MNRTFFRMAAAGMTAFLLITSSAPLVHAADGHAEKESVQTGSTTVTFSRNSDSEMESAVITGISRYGETVWTYVTESYPRAQLDRINEIGMHEDIYYMVENGTILAFDAADGSILWKNSDFGGSASCAAFDENGTLYTCGYYGPELFIVDAAGNTVRSIDSFDSDYAWPYEIQYLQTCLAITFEMTPSGESQTLYIDLDDYSYSFSNDHMSVGVDAKASVSSYAISSVSATSYLQEPQYGLDHLPSYVTDGTLDNAWVEDAPGQGEGESVTIQLDGVYLVSGFDIYAGYQKNSDIYEKNSRPSKLSVTLSDGTVLNVSLKDYYGRQTVTFPDALETSSVTFAIQSVYPGYKYEDTTISEIILF